MKPGQKTPVGSYLVNSRLDSDFGQLLSAERFVSSAKAAGVNFDNYSYIRTLACYSGDGEATSFAAQLNKLTGKPVKGYMGEVNVGSTVDPDLFYSIFKNRYSNNPLGFVNDVLTHKGSLFEIYKGTGSNYHPVYFGFPDLSAM